MTIFFHSSARAAAMLLPMRLSPLDLGIVAAYLVGITLFGLHFRGNKDRSLRGYFLASRTIPWWAIALSIVSAETSTLTIISVPGIAFTGDMGFLQIVFGYMAGRIVVALLFLPKYFQGEMLTAYQLIEQRFGNALHKTTAILFLFTRAAAEGVRIFAISIVVGIAIGTGNVLSIAIISALTLLYTFEGGMAAVVWTDVVQMAIYVAGTLIAMVTLGQHVPGGWHAIHQIGGAAGKFHVLHFAFNLTQSYTFWAGLIGGMFLTMASHGTDQLMVQRMLAARTLGESRLALLSSGVIILLQFTLFLLIGAGLFVFYGQHPQSFASSDRIFPAFIVQQMPRGVAGLLIASILAAAMSNLSAALNSLSSTTVVDLWMSWRPAADDSERQRVARGSTVGWALMLFAIALYALRVGGKGHVVEAALSIASVAYGALLGVFLLGTLNRSATQAGAIVGMISGFSVNVALWLQPAAIVLGNTPPGRPLAVLPQIAFTWYVPIGSAITFAVGSLASLVLGRQARRQTAAALLLVLTLALPSSLLAQNVPPSTPSLKTTADFASLDRLMLDAVAAKKLPGAVVQVGHSGRVVHERAYGNRAEDPALEAMTVDTIFDMASLTKCLVTATAVMQLYEQGKVDLDVPVAQYLPAFAAHGKQQVTVRELLTHYSGLPADVDLKDAWTGKAEGVRRAMDSPLEATPGTKFHYSDINYIALGVLVETISGEPLALYAQRHIFEPLAMHETSYLPAPALIARIAPTAHNDDGPLADDRLLRGVVHDPTTRRMGGVAGHAGIFSTAHDIGLFAQALLDRLAGQPSAFPLRQPTLLMMTTPEQPGHTPEDLRQPAPGTAPSYPSRNGRHVRGLGWDIDSVYSRPRGTVFPVGSFGHTGFTGTSLWMDPGSDTYVLLLANAIHPRGRAPISGLRGEVATEAARALALTLAQDPAVPGSMTTVATGIDVLESTHYAALREAAARHSGHLRLGLLTNQTGVDRSGRRTADLLKVDAAWAVAGLELKRLFSPEHGIAGALDSTDVRDSRDAGTGLAVRSLYGAKDADRRPRAEDLADLDAVVIDLQDAGVRFYTYEAVTGYFVEAAAKAGVELIVLDRPALIGGTAVRGPVSDAGRESYTNYMPMPVQHGMTLGELACFFNGERHLGATITVVRMEGWRRALFYDQTGLPWVNPSPNLRSIAAAVLYPAVALGEMTNLSVGRGSATPFELFGAGEIVASKGKEASPAWFSAAEVSHYLTARGIPGVQFEPTTVPIAKDANHYPYHGQTIAAVRLRTVDRSTLDAPELGIEILAALHTLYPQRFVLAKANTLVAHRATMAALERGDDPRAMAAAWAAELADFLSRRARYLLY